MLVSNYIYIYIQVVLTCFCFLFIEHSLDKRRKNRMGQTWMGLSWWTDEFIDGFDTFLDFEFNKPRSRGKIVC